MSEQTTAQKQGDKYSVAYVQTYEQIQKLRPDGFDDTTIVFGDLSPANLVLSEDNRLKGLIDWTELGLGDIHRELRPVFAAIGEEAFDGALETFGDRFGNIDVKLIRLLAAQHELAVLVGGKQKGQLTTERRKLALDLIAQWLEPGWRVV